MDGAGEECWADASKACHRRSKRGGRSTHARTERQIITFNGEIYNYRELRTALADRWRFRTKSDTECILACYEIYGADFLSHLRGMFAFALWDERNKRLIAARDRFGIKPFYYAIVDGVLYFASETKALLPFLPEIDTNSEALAEYLTFQYTIGEKTLFKHVHQLLPGHCLVTGERQNRNQRYWDVRYDIDWEHSATYFRASPAGAIERKHISASSR